MYQATSAIEIDFIVQSFEADSQQRGGSSLIVFGLLESPHDHLAFNFLERRANRKGDCIFVSLPLALVDWIRRKMVSLDLFSRANDNRALDYVAQLPNIPWPGVKLQSGDCRGTEESSGPPMLFRQLRYQMLGEKRQIFFAIPQRGEMNSKNVHPV
jgi:hypothetical protein